MRRPIAILRPEPGNAATAGRIAAIGLTPIRLPLFATTALAWQAPDPADFDALILTSANAARLAGPALDRLTALPVHAVGAATALAARERGLSVVSVGQGDGSELVAGMARNGVRRALLLGARERRVDEGGIVARAIAVYASEPLSIAPEALAALAGSVALLHSARAAARLAAAIDAAAIGRAGLRLAAISPPVAAAAGSGWGDVATAAAPSDDALIAVAVTLAD